MSLPRRLTLISKDVIGQEPAVDLSSLHFGGKKMEGIRLPANKEIVLKGIKGNAMEIHAEIDMLNAQIVELNVLRSPDKEEYTRIVVYKDKGFSRGLDYQSTDGTVMMPADLLVALTNQKTYAKSPRLQQSYVSIESDHSSILPDVRLRPPETGSFVLDPEENINLRVFIDKSIVEVFVNGKQCVAVRVYPGRDDSVGVSLKALGREALLKSLDAWQMKSIYID